MKKSSIPMLAGILLLVGVPASSTGNPPVSGETKPPGTTVKEINEMNGNRLRIRIGAKIFVATLADNPTAAAFKAMLPLDTKMSDLHGNEKFFDLPSRLPSSDANPGTIHTGDLMLWSSKSVVIFYKTFPATYSYTKLGKIDNPDGLSAAMGAGDVTIRFELE